MLGIAYGLGVLPACLPGMGLCQEETVDLGAEGKAES